MTKIQFNSGIIVTIQDGELIAPTSELTALLDALAARLPGYGSSALDLHADFDIARGIIAKIGAGKIVFRDELADNESGEICRRINYRGPAN